MRRLINLLIAVPALAAAACAGAPPTFTEMRGYSEQPAPDVGQVARWASSFDSARFETSGGDVLRYRVLRSSSSRPLPLVVVLHGSGAMGSDNKAQLGPFAASWAQREVGPAIIVVPQVAQRSAEYQADSDGLPASRAGASLPGLLELIDALRSEEAVDPRRVHLVGFSMGASAALQLALARPGVFESVTAFSPVPPPRSLGRSMRGEEVTIIHGDADTENPFAASEAWVAALRSQGSHPRFVVYRGMDHRVPSDMLASAQWRAAIIGSTGERTAPAQ